MYQKMNSPFGRATKSSQSSKMSQKRKNETDESKPKKPRSSEADIRNDHLDQGAILLEFIPHKDAPNEIVTAWKQMEKYGFLVTDDGCMFPHKQYWGSKGNRPPARVMVTQFFFAKKAEKKPRNDDGWPCDEQYSHKCHVFNCASPDCIIIEEQWKNLKRNFCGSSGNCDCGNEIKCTRKYHNDEWERNFDYLSYDTPNLKEEIKKWLPKGLKFKILPKDHYYSEDEKKRNRNLRKKKGKK